MQSGVGPEWSPLEWNTKVSRESDIRTQSHCVLKLFLKVQLHNTKQGFHPSLGRRGLRRSVRSHPYRNDRHDWIMQWNSGVTPIHFLTADTFFCRAAIYVIHLWAFTDFSFTWLCALMLLFRLLIPKLKYRTCYELLTAEQRDGLCIFNQLLSSCTPHPGSLSCRARETHCNWGGLEPRAFVWLQFQSSTDFPIMYTHCIPDT